jgi:hypothetical protein
MALPPSSSSRQDKAAALALRLTTAGLSIYDPDRMAALKAVKRAREAR